MLGRPVLILSHLHVRSAALGRFSRILPRVPEYAASRSRPMTTSFLLITILHGVADRVYEIPPSIYSSTQDLRSAGGHDCGAVRPRGLGKGISRGDGEC